PVLAPRLYSRNPSAQRVQEHYHERPDGIDSRQPDTISFRIKQKNVHHLFQVESLSHAQKHTQKMNQEKMRDIKSKRCAPIRDESFLDRAGDAVSNSTKNGSWSQSHQKERQAWRVFCCIEEIDYGGRYPCRL